MTGAAAGPAAEVVVLGAEPAPGLPARPARPAWRWRRALRRAGLFALGVLLAGAAWEGYKAVGNPDGGKVFGIRVLPRADDDSMPHIVEILRRFGRPETAG